MPTIEDEWRPVDPAGFSSTARSLFRACHQYTNSQHHTGSSLQHMQLWHLCNYACSTFVRDNPFKKMQCHEIVWIIQFERASLLREPNDFANFCKFSKIFVVFLHGADPDSAVSDVRLTFITPEVLTTQYMYFHYCLITIKYFIPMLQYLLMFMQSNKLFLKNCLL